MDNVYAATCNYISIDNKEGFFPDMRHILAKTESEAEDIYEKLMLKEGKLPSSRCFSKGYSVSKIKLYTKEDIA